MDKLSVDTTMIQLYALASLWIVLKRQEKFHKIPSVSDWDYSSQTFSLFYALVVYTQAAKMVSLANDLYIGREDLLVDCERKILKILNFNITFADTFSLFTHHFISCEHYINISEETGTFLYNCGCYMVKIFFFITISFLIYSILKLILLGPLWLYAALNGILLNT